MNRTTYIIGRISFTDNKHITVKDAKVVRPDDDSCYIAYQTHPDFGTLPYFVWQTGRTTRNIIINADKGKAMTTFPDFMDIGLYEGYVEQDYGILDTAQFNWDIVYKERPFNPIRL